MVHKTSRQPFSETGEFVANKVFKFHEQSFKPGDEFAWRTLSCSSRRLSQLYDGKFIMTRSDYADMVADQAERAKAPPPKTEEKKPAATTAKKKANG